MFGCRRLTAFGMHTSSDTFVIRKPGGRPGVARHEMALPLVTEPCTDKQADNRCNGRILDADGESAVAPNLD
jgi:hypothetical protein